MILFFFIVSLNKPFHRSDNCHVLSGAKGIIEHYANGKNLPNCHPA